MTRTSLTSLTQPETNQLRRSVRNLVATGLAIACSVSPALAQPARNQIHRNIAAGVLSEVAFTTLPNAVCTLSSQGVTDEQHVIKLFADDAGNIRFHAKPPADAQNVTAQLEAHCEANGQAVVHAIELQPAVDAPDSSSSSADNTRANDRTNNGSRNVRVRPALKGDPMLFTSEELVLQGYPPRPDPDQAPDAFATWMHAVSKPSTFVAPKVVNTGRYHGVANGLSSTISPISVLCCHGPITTQKSFNNWSGYALRDGNKYDAVIGEWTIPSVTGESSTTDYSSFWIGLDGDASPDVLQDGTEQEILTISFFGSNWVFTTYYAWTEWFPLGEQQISNFNVYPGDVIYSTVWIGNGPTADITGTTGYFFFEDITTGQYTTLSTGIPSGTTFQGNCAEWVLERPTHNNALTDLSDYRSANMSSAYAHRSGGGIYFMPYTGASNDQITMTDTTGVRKLSTVSSTGSSTMSFTWLNFK